MAITVRVQNFQSIEDATIVIDGFTVVTGPNNSGKSALQRAIRGVFTNPPAGALVRQGAKYLSVTITFPDGQTVCWEKGTKVNRYIINGGKPLEGLGKGGVPEEVLKLGVRSIKTGNEKIWPQIAEQFTGQVFLLDRPGSMLAEAVADVEKVGQLSLALKLSEKDRRAALSSLTVRRKDEKKLQAEVEGYAGLDLLETQVASLEDLLGEAAQSELEVGLLEDIHRQITEVQAEVLALESIQKVSVPEAALVQEAASVCDQLQGCADLLQQHSLAQSAVAGLEGIQQVPIPAAAMVQEARESRDEAAALQELHDKMERLQRALTVLEAMVAASKSLVLGESATEASSRIQAALMFFRQLQDDLDTSYAAIRALEQELLESQEALSDADSTVSTVLLEMGACPTCHQRMGVHHIHETV